MAIELTIHGTGTGTCSFSGKECEGLTVSFSDGTVKEAFLSTKAFHQLVKMKCGGSAKKPPAVPQAQPVNGPPVPAKT